MIHVILTVSNESGAELRAIVPALDAPEVQVNQRATRLQQLDDGHTGRFVWQVFAASGGNPVINASFTAIGPDQQSINMTVACQ